MGEWAALAEELADALLEPGFGAAACVAASWSARVDPAATRCLVTAAMVLAGDGALTALWEPLPPCPDLATLLTWGEELESHLGDLLKRCAGLGAAARAEHAAAVKAHARALAAERQASASAATAASAAARSAAQCAAQTTKETTADAARVIADTEAALDCLGETDGRLRYALDLVRALPADADETYEAANRLVRDGGTLPHDGDWIAPSPRTPDTEPARTGG